MIIKLRRTSRELGVYAVLLVLYAYNYISEPSFRGWHNLVNVLSQISIVALVGAGMSLVIIAAGIDLSVGSVAALCACTGAHLVVIHHLSGGIGIGITLMLGAAVGLFNGISITKVGLPPFIATLAVMVVARGLAFLISGGGAIYSLPNSYLWPGSGNIIAHLPVIGFLPFMIFLMLAVFAAGMVLLQKTRLGRYVYGVGSNEEAARLAGVPTANVKIFCYTITGLLAGVAGLLLTGYVGAAEPTLGDGMELDVIAAVVIGGASLSGGQGNLAGTLAGALLIGLVRNGLNLHQVDSNWQKVAIGSIIYFAVMLDMYQKKRRRV